MKLNKSQVETIMARKQLTIRDVCLRGDININTFKQAKSNRYKKITPRIAGKIAAALGVDVTEILKDGE